MNPFFKNINIFLAPKIYFSKKNFEKLNIFYRNFWIVSNNYLKIFNFYETYKSREIFGEFSYLVEKFTVAAQGIFSGHLKTIKRPPHGVRGAKAPRTVANFHFSNDSKYLKMNSFLKNVNIFLPQKIHFF